MFNINSYSEDDTKKMGSYLGEIVPAGSVIALYGDLGAGKTVFAKGLGEGLQVKDVVTSPSFVLLNIYRGRLEFYHFDFYRLDEEEELQELGLDEFFYGGGVTLIEWAEKFPSILPSTRLDIFLQNNDEVPDYRTLCFKPCGNFNIKLIEEMKKACSS